MGDSQKKWAFPSFTISDLSESLTDALLSWVPWVIRSFTHLIAKKSNLLRKPMNELPTLISAIEFLGWNIILLQVFENISCRILSSHILNILLLVNRVKLYSTLTRTCSVIDMRSQLQYCFLRIISFNKFLSTNISGNIFMTFIYVAPTFYCTWQTWRG